MSDSIFNRPRRQVEPRVHDERGRDFGGIESRSPDQGAVERRDPGADALLELARLIGETEPFAPLPGRANEARNPDGRVIDVPGGSNSPDRGAHGRTATGADSRTGTAEAQSGRSTRSSAQGRGDD